MTTKDKVLTILKKSNKEAISGEDIANTLSLSRTSVWKAINGLKKDGYNIQASTNKGYILIDDDILNKEGIVSILGKDKEDLVEVKKQTISTNIDLMEMLQQGKGKQGMLIATERQLKGRGRIGREFVSPYGGVYFSIILDISKVPLNKATIITPAAAVAVRESIKELTGIDTHIKWVNDIYLNGKKLCGILTQASTDIETGVIKHAVVGIGINFETDIEEFPKELRSKVISLFNKDNKKTTKNQLVALIYKKLMEYTKDLENPTYMDLYKKYSLVIGKTISFIKNEKEYNAKCIDIDNMGGLIIKMQDNTIQTLTSGEVSINCLDGWI